MANSTYFPNTKPEQAAWYTNMAANFPSVAEALGFSTPERVGWVADCKYAAFVLGELAAPVATFATAVTGYVNTVIGGPAGGPVVPLPTAPTWPPTDGPASVDPGIDGRRQKTVDRIKSSAAYTKDVIGKLLRTENTGDPFNPANSTGLIRSLHLNAHGQVTVAFSKQGGEVDGVNVYMQRAGETAWTKVGLFTHTPAVDPTPLKVAGQPEERTYTVINVINDQEVGQRSPAMTILVR